MTQAMTTFAALLSALAAAVGAAVSVAQWRQAQPKHPATTETASGRSTPPVPRAHLTAGATRNVHQRPTAAARAAVLGGTVCCLFSAIGNVAYWTQQAQDNPNAAQESVVSVMVLLMVVTSFLALTLGLFVGVRGVVQHRKHDRMLSLVAMALSLTPWVSFWITDLINA